MRADAVPRVAPTALATAVRCSEQRVLTFFRKLRFGTIFITLAWNWPFFFFLQARATHGTAGEVRGGAEREAHGSGAGPEQAGDGR